jgi:hypothetical protein
LFDGLQQTGVTHLDALYLEVGGGVQMLAVGDVYIRVFVIL